MEFTFSSQLKYSKINGLKHVCSQKIMVRFEKYVGNYRLLVNFLLFNCDRFNGCQIIRYRKSGNGELGVSYTSITFSPNTPPSPRLCSLLRYPSPCRLSILLLIECFPSKSIFLSPAVVKSQLSGRDNNVSIMPLSLKLKAGSIAIPL